MSRVVLPTNCAWEPTLILLFSAPILSVLGGSSPFLGIGIFLIIMLLLPSRLLRILQLHGLHRIHLKDLSRDYDNLSIRNISLWV